MKRNEANEIRTAESVVTMACALKVNGGIRQLEIDPRTTLLQAGMPVGSGAFLCRLDGSAVNCSNRVAGTGRGRRPAPHEAAKRPEAHRVPAAAHEEGQGANRSSTSRRVHTRQLWRVVMA